MHLAKLFNSSVFDGLDKPQWRQTVNLDDGALIESRPVESLSMTESLPDGVSNIQTTVWYGVRAKPTRKSIKKKNMVKGIQRAAAVLLLEAMVLLATGTQWAGSWTQKAYGTGTADVWEICGNHSTVTQVAWQQGWRILEPFVHC